MAEAIKAANAYLRRFPKSKACINIHRYSPNNKESSMAGWVLMGALYYATVDDKRQIIFSSGRGYRANKEYSIINKDGSFGKKGLHKEYLYDGYGLIRGARYHTR